MKLLIVDDNREVLSCLETALSENGFSTRCASTAEEALSILTKEKFSALIIDWNLPTLSGLEICKNFRFQGGETPIIFISEGSEITDKEAAFAAGADDYVTKPFEVRELIARIRNLQARSPFLNAADITIGPARLELAARRLVCEDQVVQLSAIEASILTFLAVNANTPQSSAQILKAIWPESVERDDSIVRVHVNSLREKLEAAGLKSMLRTVKGRGYLVLNQIESFKSF